jgi:hypothetical protein
MPNRMLKFPFLCFGADHLFGEDEGRWFNTRMQLCRHFKISPNCKAFSLLPDTRLKMRVRAEDRLVRSRKL